MTSNYRYILILLLGLVITMPSLVQAQDESFKQPTAVDIIEVMIRSNDFGSDLVDVGRGWAYTLGTEEGSGCRIIAPWHVVGDPSSDRFPRDEILVSGPGQNAAYKAEIEKQDLIFLETDVAVLNLIAVNACPFSGVRADSLSKQGIYLRRRNEVGGIDQIVLDAAKGFIPQSDTLDIIKAYPESYEVEGIKSGWSGSTIFVNGNRIGMVTEVRKAGREIYFVSAYGMQRLFGNRVQLLDTAGTQFSSALDALATRGIAFNSKGLSELLEVADVEGLKLFREAGGTIEMTEAALGRTISEKSAITARLLFQATKTNTGALDWLGQEFARGLDPNLRVSSERYGDETLLAEAIRTGNLAAIELLINAGTAPHPLHSLRGVTLSSPFIIDVLEAISTNDHMTADEKLRTATMLIEAGAFLPSAAIREAGGQLSRGIPDDRNIMKRDTREVLHVIGIKGQSVTPDMCANPTPSICKKASEVYGFDWCNVLAGMPKGFAGSGEGAHQIPPFFFEHLIGIDQTNAYFIVRSARNSTRIASFSKDLTQVNVWNYGMNYNCRPREDGTAPSYCWKKFSLQRSGATEGYKGNFGRGEFRFIDTCQLADQWDKNYIKSAPDTTWAAALDQVATPLDFPVIHRHQFTGLNLTDSIVDAIASEIIRTDHSSWRTLSGLRQSAPEIAQTTILWPQVKNDAMKRAAFFDYVLQGERRPAPDFVNAAQNHFGAFVFTADEVEGRDQAFMIPEVRSVIRDLLTQLQAHNAPKDLYVITALPRLMYDTDSQSLINGTNRKSELGAFQIGQPLRDPRFITAIGNQLTERTAAYPDAVRGRYLLQLTANRFKTLVDNPSIGAQYDLRQRLGWSFSYQQNIRAAALALDRIVSISAFPIAPAEAERLLKTTQSYRMLGEGWRLVTVLTNAQGIHQFYPDIEPATIGFALSADVKEVLLIAPTGELVMHLPADHFPKAQDYYALTNKIPETPRIAPSKLPLTQISLDFILAKFNPNSIDDTLARGMFLSRWFYEKAVTSPLGGRYFNVSAKAPSNLEIDEALPAFRDWLIAAAKTMPNKMVATTTLTRYDLPDGKFLYASTDGCIFGLYTDNMTRANRIISRMINLYNVKIQRQGEVEPIELPLQTFASNAGNRQCTSDTSEIRGNRDRDITLGAYKVILPASSLGALIQLRTPLEPTDLPEEYFSSTNYGMTESNIGVELTIHNATAANEDDILSQIDTNAYIKLDANATWTNATPAPQQTKSNRRR